MGPSKYLTGPNQIHTSPDLDLRGSHQPLGFLFVSASENGSCYGVGQESAGQRSEENGLIDDNECAKRDIEEFVHRALYVMVASLKRILL